MTELNISQMIQGVDLVKSYYNEAHPYLYLKLEGDWSCFIKSAEERFVDNISIISFGDSEKADIVLPCEDASTVEYSALGSGTSRVMAVAYSDAVGDKNNLSGCMSILVVIDAYLEPSRISMVYLTVIDAMNEILTEYIRNAKNNHAASSESVPHVMILSRKNKGDEPPAIVKAAFLNRVKGVVRNAVFNSSVFNGKSLSKSSPATTFLHEAKCSYKDLFKMVDADNFEMFTEAVSAVCLDPSVSNALSSSLWICTDLDEFLINPDEGKKTIADLLKKNLGYRGQVSDNTRHDIAHAIALMAFQLM